MLSFKTVLVWLLNAVYTASSGGVSSELDTAPYVGNVWIGVSDRASGTAAATVTVEHSDTSGSGFTAVPASALFNPNTGAAASFPNLSTAAYSQYLGLNRQQLKRYVRVAIAGTTITHNVAVVAAVQQEYTETN